MTEHRQVIVTDVNEKPSRGDEAQQSGHEPLEPGKRYWVTIEGVAHTDRHIRLVGASEPLIRMANVTSVERIPDPEPAWKYDDIAEDVNGQKWLRVENDVWLKYPWSYDEGGVWRLRKDADMRRPLKPVMLDGRYVGGEQ
jgi:hypothetical protein